MRLCKKCKEQKLEEEFYKCKAYADGLARWCKICYSVARKKHQQTEKYKKTHLEYQSRYSKTEKGKEAFRRYKQRVGITPKMAEYQKQYRRKYKKMPHSVEAEMKEKCRKATDHLYRTGQLVITSCVECGNSKIEKHHEDYSNPKQIVCLCKKCHMDLHKKSTLLPAFSGRTNTQNCSKASVV